jgi:hypothetical protein
MKKIIALILVLGLVFAFAGCKKEAEHDHSQTTEIASNTEHVTKELKKAPSFSYEDEKSAYDKNPVGVVTTGFKNTTKTTVITVKEAIVLAKKEQSVKSDSVNVYYDADAKVTKVVFYTEGQVGGDQSVYIDKDGLTILIHYGE